MYGYSLLPLFCPSNISQESHIRGSKGLIAPFTPEDNRKGGHPWVLSGLKQNTTLLLKTLTVWVASHTIKAIELKLSDDWMSIAVGRSQDHNEGAYAQGRVL